MDVEHILHELETGASELNVHVRTLYHFAKRSKRPLELGVMLGNSTTALMCACHEDRKRLCSCDIQPYDGMVRKRLRQAGLDDNLWKFVLGDDINPETIARLRLLSPSFDLVFIDTSHQTQHTGLELENYYPLLEPGGIMIFHDTHTPLYAGGVYEPILQFIGSRPECHIIYDSYDAYGLTAFRKRRGVRQ